VAAGDLARNLQHIREHRRPCSSAAGTTAIEHLRSNFFDGDEDCIVGAVHFGQHGVSRLKPRLDRHVDSIRRAFR
jgi:hypothetical protein